MALVPAANGVESIAAAQGIRIVDTGANRFTVGLNARLEFGVMSDMLEGPWPAGFTEVILGEPQQFGFNGIYLVQIKTLAGLTIPGDIVAGPDDRIVAVLKRDDRVVLIVPMKIYNGVAVTHPQRQGVASMLATQDGAVYEVAIQVYNESGTFEPRGIQMSMEFIPLTSVQGPADAAPAPILVSPR
jgi:hypothetical protein